MHGLDWYDYHARQYDGIAGQFWSMDQLCEKYYHISPYAYCAGNPVKYVDPDGRAFNLALGGIGAVIGGTVEAGIAVYQGKSYKEVMIAAAKGVVEGGVAGLTMGASLKVQAVCSVGASALESVGEQLVTKGNISAKQTIDDTEVGIFTFAAGASVGKGLTKLSHAGQKAVEKHYAQKTVKDAMKKEVATELKAAGFEKSNGKAFKQKVNNRLRTMQNGDKCFIRGTAKVADYTQQRIISRTTQELQNSSNH